MNGGASTSSDASTSESSSTASSSELDNDVAGLLGPDLQLLGADLEDALGLAAGRGGLNAFRSVAPVERAGGMVIRIFRLMFFAKRSSRLAIKDPTTILRPDSFSELTANFNCILGTRERI